MDGLAKALSGLRLGQPLHSYETIGSTNDEARRLAEAGAPEGTLVTAETQTAGRGRAGRSWQTPAGAALALSLVLRPALKPAQAARLTMLAGLAVAGAVEGLVTRPVTLKWPNDVLVGGAKAGGILVESGLTGDKLDFVVVGIGLNVSFAPPPEAVQFPATALQEAGAAPVDRARLVRAVLEQIERLSPLLTRSGDDVLRERWAARLAWLGENVTVSGPGVEWTGVAEGVDADGALLVRLAGGELRQVLAGDVRVRGRVIRGAA
jgi:BirA family biotin operon repressor/biotin-[acetyl-CoA-carboxylase] ligase